MTVSIIDVDIDLLQLHQLNPRRYPFLLESSGENSRTGCMDILFCCPGNVLELNQDSLVGPFSERGSFLAALDGWFQEESGNASKKFAQPFAGGWFLYLGYELLAEIEPTVPVFEDSNMPIALAVRCPVTLVKERNRQGLQLVVDDSNADLGESVLSDIRNLPNGTHSGECTIRTQHVVEEPAEDYLQAVQTAKRYIHDGDVFQANLSRLWQAELEPGTTDSALYSALRRANPAPFSGLCKWGDATIASSSPERLIQSRDRNVQTRPIAGTRKRSDVEPEDDMLSEELLAHPKERAEHIMLVDLERNDIGRIAKTGTVTVDEFMVLESYAHVHHIVSNVSGVLKDDVLPGDIIKAVFPGGTITGCPKVRCMEIISELERNARGAYTGSMGYLALDGSMDLNILIRTMVRKGNRVSFRAGAGIVADSVPQSELEETRAKARGMLQALE